MENLSLNHPHNEIHWKYKVFCSSCGFIPTLQTDLWLVHRIHYQDENKKNKSVRQNELLKSGNQLFP